MVTQMMLFDSTTTSLPHSSTRPAWAEATSERAVPPLSIKPSRYGADRSSRRADAELCSTTGGEESGELAAMGQQRGGQPRRLGDLAQLVLARYDLLARRRQQLRLRRSLAPRKSIRVLVS